jgi:hypothetical protein
MYAAAQVTASKKRLGCVAAIRDGIQKALGLCLPSLCDGLQELKRK